MRRFLAAHHLDLAAPLQQACGACRAWHLCAHCHTYICRCHARVTDPRDTDPRVICRQCDKKHFAWKRAVWTLLRTLCAAVAGLCLFSRGS
jgi:hypothetical protein